MFADGLKWTPSGQHLEAWLNDDYVGVYVLTEDIRVDPARLDLKKMSATAAANDVDGGYIVEVDARLDCFNSPEIDLRLFLFNLGARHGPALQMKPFFDALYAGGVDIVLSGHEHLYERFAPQTADGAADPARGVRQFTVGTGGAALDTFAQPLPNSEARVAGNWGILRLTLGDGRYSWQFAPAAGGAALDSGQDVCHR